MASRVPHRAAWPLLAALAACSSGELSRSQAEQVLATAVPGSAGTVRILRWKCVERYWEKYPIRFVEDAQLARQYQLLEQAGLVTQWSEAATTERCGTPYPESLRVMGINLTPTGEAEGWPGHHERGGGWDIELGRRRFAGVTAITPEPDPSLVRVTYQWQVVPTPGGLALGQSPELRESSALFRRSDGEWRMERGAALRPQPPRPPR